MSICLQLQAWSLSPLTESTEDVWATWETMLKVEIVVKCLVCETWLYYALLCMSVFRIICMVVYNCVRLKLWKKYRSLVENGLFSSASLEWSRDVSTGTILVISNINRTCQLQNRRSHRSLYVWCKVCLHLSLYMKKLYTTTISRGRFLKFIYQKMDHAQLPPFTV